jgi:hypothetical protein
MRRRSLGQQMRKWQWNAGDCTVDVWMLPRFIKETPTHHGNDGARDDVVNLQSVRYIRYSTTNQKCRCWADWGCRWRSVLRAPTALSTASRCVAVLMT